ncbi:unnamed protein product [Cuscuta epithymum]|uniref:Uncharacterized protein n=1 Tax=Cuscuta epithymum TaxID=186058 RepID=A0AAV0F163_9ASTE|nr:unnamed protein product [Cuscuta epithymum]
MEAMFQEFFTPSSELVYCHLSTPQDSRFVSGQRSFNPSSGFSVIDDSLPHNKSATTEEDQDEGDYPNATLKYISQMLMEEEDLENQPFMLSECMALQATEKHFSDVLNGTDSPRDALSWSDRSPSKGKREHEYSSSDNESPETHQRNKYLASNDLEESEPLEYMCYDVLLDPGRRRNIAACLYKKMDNKEPKAGGKPRRGKKKPQIRKEIIDLSGLLTLCAQSVAIYDSGTANETLKKIRLHSSPYGTGTERMAFYIANALEARLNGTATSLYQLSHHFNKISAADTLKAYKMFINACPFNVVSTMMANKRIMKLAARASRLHIIDFGILYGFQWPSLIQGLSMRRGGPPTLRITGIDFLLPGFHPEELVKATGLRLEKYCKGYGVPFEFKSVAKEWESITLEDLDIERRDDGDVLVVNCLDMLGIVSDETLVPNNSPRDIVLNLIKDINPDMFTHGVLNGTFNATFFATRFREALFHFSSLFDMFDATVPREENDRQLYEKMIFGRDVLNVIACEGTERIERPETYKQWQVRSLGAGFQQLPLDQDIVCHAPDLPDTSTTRRTVRIVNRSPTHPYYTRRHEYHSQ